jgi:hypothetical protein
VINAAAGPNSQSVQSSRKPRMSPANTLKAEWPD